MTFGMGIKVYFAQNLKNQIVIIKDRKVVLNKKFKSGRNTLEKLNDLVGNSLDVELNKQSYSLLCKHKKNMCLIVK